MFGRKPKEFTYQERPLQICCDVNVRKFTEMDFERKSIEDNNILQKLCFTLYLDLYT